MKGFNLMQNRKEEEKKQSRLISSTYNNEQDIYNDIYAKIELIKYMSLDNETLEYSLSMYATDIQILLKALNYYKE